MKRLNWQLIVGNVVNAFIALCCAASNPSMHVLNELLGYSILLGIVGTIVTAAVATKAGPVMVAISSVLFLPIGLLSMIGVRKAIAQVDEAEFEAAAVPVLK